MKKRTGNRNPLMLSTGELAGVPLGEMFKTDRFKVCKDQIHYVLGFFLELVGRKPNFLEP